MRASCWFLYLKKSAITFGEGCMIWYHTSYDIIYHITSHHIIWDIIWHTIWHVNLRSCVLNRHKLRKSQIATLPSQFVICRNLWSKPWRHKLSPITLKTSSGYLAEYPGLLLTLIWKVVFLPILVLFHWFICLCLCISVIKLIIVVPRKPSSWKGLILMWICFLNLEVYPRLLLISIWIVVFWTVTNCDSHKLRHYRRNLWFVAICDQSPDGINWVQ